MKNHKHIIWSDEDEAFDCLCSDIADEYGMEPDDPECVSMASDLIGDYLADERLNLNIKTGDIVAIGDIGRWNGRFHGYKECGNNLSNILYSDCDTATWYCDQYNVKSIERHHDGTNYITYRERRDGVTDEQWERFLNKIYNNDFTDRDIRRFTTSLRPYVAEVYGW